MSENVYVSENKERKEKQRQLLCTVYAVRLCYYEHLHSPFPNDDRRKTILGRLGGAGADFGMEGGGSQLCPPSQILDSIFLLKLDEIHRNSAGFTNKGEI
jgi:hypothetical protein